MATRSAIIVKYDEKDYRGIYCHFDGCPKGVGATLKKNFNTIDLAKEIIELGDCSVIADCVRIKPIGEHSFNKPEKGTIIAYHRDRQEPFKKPVKESTWKWVAKSIDHAYIYVFENNEWTCYSGE